MNWSLTNTRAASGTLRSLGTAEAMRFSQAWDKLQSRFVDNPKAAVADADTLVRQLLERRGYLVGGIDRSGVDLPDDHPTVVTTFLAARAITARHARLEADTEALRKAIVYYRALLNELLDASFRAAPVATPQGSFSLPA